MLRRLCGLLEHVVVVDEVMMSDVAQFDVGGVEECENNAIGSVHAKAPHFVMLGMEFSLWSEG